MITRPLSALISSGMVAVALTAPAEATAATVAPGAPIRVQSQTPSVDGLPPELDTASCTQALAGTVLRADGTRSEILLTSAHCVVATGDGFEPTDEVFVPKQGGNQPVGHRELYALEIPQTGNVVGDLVGMTTGQDWATVALNPGVSTSRASESVDQFGNSHGAPVILTGIRDYSDLAAGEVSVDNFGQRVCKDGATTGRSCGTQLFRTHNSVFHAGVNYAAGDSGGINFDPDTGEAIGITTEAIGPIGRAQTADAALQQAYGIPDGQINDQFHLAESTEGHDTDFRTLGEDQAATQAWVQQNSEPLPDFRAEFDGEVSAAQAEAGQYAAQLETQVISGDTAAAQATAGEAAAAAGRYAESLPTLGFNAAAQDFLGA